MLGIVVSRADEASVVIGEQLREIADWMAETDETRPDADGGGTVYRMEDVELREFDRLHLELTNVDEAFTEIDLLVFASKHAGDTGRLLTAHHTGNFGVAEFGGEDGHLARACPNAHREAVHAFAEYAPDGYDVGMECTHHGPTAVGVPSMFVEVGSSEDQWRDATAARAAARAILDLRDVAADAPPEDGSRRHLVGFGCGHYAPRFERVVRETDWSVGHIAANWCLDALAEWAEDDEQQRAVLQRAFEASAADYALLDGDRPELQSTIESLGYRVVSETFVRETTGVPLEFVETLERAVGSVADGLRFGELATGYDGEWSLASVPEELIADARGIDDDAVRTLVESQTLSFGTEQNGTVVTGPLVLPLETDANDLVDGLIEILRTQYDSVERTDDEIVARETTFDPALADAAGIPEGPKFGTLAAGEPIEIDGDEIGPERFQRERIRRFTL